MDIFPRNLLPDPTAKGQDDMFGEAFCYVPFSQLFKAAAAKTEERTSLKAKEKFSVRGSILIGS